MGMFRGTKAKLTTGSTTALCFALGIACSSSNGPSDGSGGSDGNLGGANGSGSTSSGTGGEGNSGSGSTSSGGVGNPDWGTPDEEAEGGAPAPTGYATCGTAGTVSSIGAAWDTTDNDGPDDHNTKYGARPRLVAATRGDGSFDFAWQEPSKTDVHVTHIAKTGDTYAAMWTVSVPSLGQVGGLAITAEGDPVLATAVEEAISGSVSPEKTHRDDILELVRLGDDCGEVYRTQLRADFDGETTRLPVYQPYQAGSSRLAVGGGKFTLHFAQMTEYDEGVTSRHQIGRVFQGTVSDGKLSTIAGSISHSFDQRIFFDGTDFILAALGDASHRGIEVSRMTPSGGKTNRNIFSVKGGGKDTGGGYNNTFTRLGGSAKSKNGYVHVFSSEAGNVIAKNVNVSRNFAFVHTPANFDTIEQPEQYVVTATDTSVGNDSAESWDVDITNYWDESFAAKNKDVVFVTNYADRETAHVERPRIVRWGENRFFLLWEKWTFDEYVETVAAVTDEYGNLVVEPKSLGQARLSRGDDAFLLSGKAAWLESHDGKVHLHTVDKDLAHTDTEL